MWWTGAARRCWLNSGVQGLPEGTIGEETGLPRISKGRRESPASAWMREYSENGGRGAGAGREGNGQFLGRQREGVGLDGLGGPKLAVSSKRA